MRYFAARVLGAGTALLCPIALLLAQQQPGSAATRPSLVRVGCESCVATLRILADMDCAIMVDGEKLGKIAQDGGKSVGVGLGEHLIAAQAGDLKWQTTLTVDKPGQRLIKTDLQSVKKAIEGLKPWQGDWYGQIYYQQPMGSVTFYYFQSFEVKVEGPRCTITRKFGSANGPPLPASYKMSSVPPTTCSTDKDGFVTDGNVKLALAGGTRSVTFEDGSTHETHSLPLVDAAASTTQGNSDVGEDPLKAGLQAWAGEWEGEVDWQIYASSSSAYSQRHGELSISVGRNSTCSATWNEHEVFHYSSGNVSAGKDHQSTLQCQIQDSHHILIITFEVSDIVKTGTNQAQTKWSNGFTTAPFSLRRTSR
jgi:hypothetical protein